MKNRLFILIFLIHFGVSTAGFLSLSAWALAAQDAGMAVPTGSAAAGATPAGAAVPAFRWLEACLHFVLLQPVAHWLLASYTIAWWTWSGLFELSGLIAVNSLIVSGIAVGCLRKFRADV